MNSGNIHFEYWAHTLKMVNKDDDNLCLTGLHSDVICKLDNQVHELYMVQVEPWGSKLDSSLAVCHLGPTASFSRCICTGSQSVRHSLLGAQEIVELEHDKIVKTHVGNTPTHSHTDWFLNSFLFVGGRFVLFKGK